MTTRRPVKKRPLLVGVIASAADLRFALTIKEPPDLFELRLDCLGNVVNQLERKMSIFSAPIIITARDPREGGMENLPFEKRCDLLARFLPHAKYVDVELHSARAFKSLLDRARKQKVRVILSFHDFGSTPSPRSLRAKALAAKKHGASIFKVATRTDNPSELAQLVGFITSKNLKLPISAMGIGKLGGLSRLLLARCGSVLTYAHLSRARVTGQPSLSEIRRWALDVER